MYMAQDGERVKMNKMKLNRLAMHQEWFDRNQHLMFLESRIVMQELLAMTREARNQRDEARRMYLASTCSEDEIIYEMKRHGWDCFKENTNE